MLEADPLQLTLESEDVMPPCWSCQTIKLARDAQGSDAVLIQGVVNHRNCAPPLTDSATAARRPRFALQAPFGMDSEQEEASARVAPG